MKIVFINGKKRAGKDTFVGYLESSARFHKIRVRAVSSIDPVREALASMGIDIQQKTPELRAAMSEIGDVLQNRFQFRSKWVCMRALDADIDATHIFVVHMREPVLIEQTIALLAQYDFHDVTKIFIESDRGDDEENSNASDRSVWQEDFYDEVYPNNGTVQELSHKAGDFLKKLMPGRTGVLP
jgi:hypothetical protein